MKVLFTYIMSFLMLTTVLFNAQGVFIEHHDCVDCTDTHITGESSSSCSSGCHMHDHESIQHEHQQCDLYNFEDKEHRSNCECFAEYVQIPVFYSEIREHETSLIEYDIFWYTSISLTTHAGAQNNVFETYFSPPDKIYQNISKQSLYCTFLC